MHLDEHVVRARRGLGDLAQLEVLGTGGLDDLDCTHGRRGYRTASTRSGNLRHGPYLLLEPPSGEMSPVIEIEVDVADLAQVRFTTDAAWVTTAASMRPSSGAPPAPPARARLVPKRPDSTLHLLTLAPTPTCSPTRGRRRPGPTRAPSGAA